MSETQPKSPERSLKGKKAAAAAGGVVLTSALAMGGVSPAFAAEPSDNDVLDAAKRVSHISDMPSNPDDAALASGHMEINGQHEYEPGAFQYDPEATCHARDAEWLAENGQPSAYIKFVYDRLGIDPETATLDQKIEAYKDAMKDCYTKDPYILASTILALQHSDDGVSINQDMINAYGDELVADPQRWQDEYEGFMGLFESSDNTCSIGRAEAGKHNSLYTSDIDTSNGHSLIYMGGASHITSDVLVVGLANGQTIALKECLQPAWVGPELEIPSDGIPHLIIDLPVLESQLCEPDGIPVIVPLLPPKEFVDKTPIVAHPVVADMPVAPIPDYAAMTGGGIDHSKGKAHQGYGSIARNYKQPTRLNDGNFSGNRKGRGITINNRTQNARRNAR